MEDFVPVTQSGYEDSGCSGLTDGRMPNVLEYILGSGYNDDARVLQRCKRHCQDWEGCVSYRMKTVSEHGIGACYIYFSDDYWNDYPSNWIFAEQGTDWRFFATQHSCEGANEYYFKEGHWCGLERPTEEPTRAPTTSIPSEVPSQEPTFSSPTEGPSQAPTTSIPSEGPSLAPTSPTKFPSQAPTATPTEVPSQVPTSSIPTQVPSTAPTTSRPTSLPSKAPVSSEPTQAPSTVMIGGAATGDSSYTL